MKLSRIEDYTGGWLIGNFEPSVLRTSSFEVGYHEYKAGQHWPKHTHRYTTEINLLIEGDMHVCGTRLYKGDVFEIEPNEVAEPHFFTDCKVLIIKVPSIPGDKILL
jgi:quercetin dioxygenase-like cupin family protein